MAKIKDISKPDMTDVLNNLRRDVQVSLNAVNIGIIQSFNPANQTATIRLALRQVVDVSPDGSREIREHPLILECPVMTLFGGAAFINLPVQAGDNCIVLFNDRQIDEWLYNGGVQLPLTARTHDISDAIAIVGIRNFQNSIPNFLPNGIRIFLNNGTKIDLTDGNVHITGDVTVDGNLTLNGDAVINGQLSTVVGATTINYNTHVHSGVASGINNTGTPVGS